MHLPDPIEMMEASAERWADENIRGDEFRCANCNQWRPLSQGSCSTVSPYSPLICDACLTGATPCR